MISVAILDRTQTRCIDKCEWSIVQKLIAKQVAVEALRGVGESPTDAPDDDTRITFVLRRQCADDERKRVVEKYLKLS